MAFTYAVFVVFVAAVSASPVTEDKCSWGPSYWCENFEQAVECKALEHCRENVWAVKDEVACEICEEIVPKIKDFLSNTTTQEEVITLLEQACSAIGEFATMCKALVDKYEPLIMTNLEKIMDDPQQVCTALGLCTSKAKETVAAKLIFKPLPLRPHSVASKPAIFKSKPYRASPQCILCEYVMGELKTILKENATQQEIEDALEEVCSILPETVRNDCNEFVQQYEPAIVQILIAELDPSIVCTTLGLCASKEHRKALEKQVTLKVGSNETCQICVLVMTYLKNLLADNATEQEILALLEQICNYLPSQIASECNALISEYGQAVLDLIATSDPKTLCEEVGLCSALKKKGNYLCSFGPSFWCANKQNAAMCNAVKHCADHVWH
ncbi:prosaposin-like [Montipora capricornis]|uniref:prosaposin-like n=1 Tax=Montipora foliosa TaxID=591990 RepID=UPI0035F18B5D